MKMENLQHLTEEEKRSWLVQKMPRFGGAEEDEITEGDLADDFIIRGNVDLNFGTLFELCNQLDWIGFELGRAEIYIDLSIARKRREGGKSFWLPNPDEFSICGSVLRIWFD